jgi:hypothetical protein
MQRRTGWLAIGIAGGAFVLLGCGGGLLMLVSVLSSRGALATVEALPMAGLIGLGLGFGIPLMHHGWAAWHARPSRPFTPSRVWLIWLTWMLLVGLGAAISSLSLHPAWLLPPVHVLTMSLPPLIALWSVGGALCGAGGSWREVVTGMVGGGTIGLGGSLIGEGLVVVVLVTFAIAVALMTPGGAERVTALVNNLRDPVWLSDLTNLASLLLSPTGAIGALAVFSFPVPLIEEALKTLASGVVARWVRPHPARAFLWGVAGGAGFALAENVFNGALGGTDGWAMGAVARFGATMMHGATGGLVGWGWGQLWAERRPWRLLGSYGAAVTVHGVWNAITIGAVLLSAGALTRQENDIWIAVASLGMLTTLGLLGLLTVTFAFALPFAGRKLAAQTEQLQAETAGLEGASVATPPKAPPS